MGVTSYRAGGICPLQRQALSGDVGDPRLGGSGQHPVANAVKNGFIPHELLMPGTIWRRAGTGTTGKSIFSLLFCLALTFALTPTGVLATAAALSLTG
jgi:hypothetical protein